MNKYKKLYKLNNENYSIQEKNYSIEKKEYLNKLRIIKKLTKIFNSYLFSSYKKIIRIEKNADENHDSKFIIIKYKINNYLIEITLFFIQDKIYEKNIDFYEFVKKYVMIYFISEQNLYDEIIINEFKYRSKHFNINKNNFDFYIDPIRNFFNIYKTNFDLIIYKTELLNLFQKWTNTKNHQIQYLNFGM